MKGLFLAHKFSNFSNFTIPVTPIFLASLSAWKYKHTYIIKDATEQP